jgi:membrane-bound lytic murein transglycosylase D
MFESWYLAASAYNAGEYKILRAIEQLKTNNYWRICETRLLRRETKDYIPKLIAAAIIAKNPSKYGFDEIDYQEPLEFETIVVDFPIHLRQIASLVDAPEDEILDLNPALRRASVPPSEPSYEIRVPTGTRVLVERAVASLRGQITETDTVAYTVKSGDTLSSIAQKHRVRASELANVNNMGNREKLVPGSSLLIPKRKIAAAQVARVSRSAGNSSDADFIIHIVRQGESLWSISEQYNVTVQDIFRWNNLSRSRIHPGKKLKIKSDKAASSTSEAKVKSRSPRRG